MKTLQLMLLKSCLLAIVLAACSWQPLLAQTEAESASNVLVFSHVKKNKVDTVAVGARVEIIARRRIFTLRGNLSQINDSSIVVKGKEIALANLKHVSVVNRRWSLISYIVIYTGMGLLLLGLFLPMIAVRYLLNNPQVPRTGQLERWSRIIGYFGGGLLFFVGDIMLIFRSRNYNLRGRWRATVQKATTTAVPKE
jgi:hypothetical protein